MATGTLSPDARLQFFDNNGLPLTGGKLYTYLAGTTTLQTTYSDVALTVANTNPIILNAAGRPSVSNVEVGVFLSPGASYKYVLQTSTGAAVWTQDNISSVPGSSANLDITGVAGEALTAGQVAYLSDGSGSKTAGQWFKADSANTYSSTTPEIGMVPATITSGGTGTIRLAGSMTGVSALTIGTLYYVGTAGATTSTAPANKRFVGQADTTSSLVLSGNPPLSGFVVSQGGTGAVTLTNHGVLIGQGTAAIVAAAVGTTGQVLTGVTGADPTFQTPAAQQVTLLKQGSGTNATGSATVVDSIAITGLTVKDTLLVYYTIESVTADTALTYLINTTDSVQYQTLCAAGGVVTAGSTFMGTATITPRQGSTTLIVARAEGWGTLAAAATAHGLRATATTAWTGAWTLGLKHNGVTATGTFGYTWVVLKVAGQ